MCSCFYPLAGHKAQFFLDFAQRPIGCPGGVFGPLLHDGFEAGLVRHELIEFGVDRGQGVGADLSDGPA